MRWDEGVCYLVTACNEGVAATAAVELLLRKMMMMQQNDEHLFPPL
jgi:hypothetical protein